MKQSQTSPIPLRTAVDRLPKAELHLHLEGSIRPETAVELAARQGVRITPEQVVARYNYSDFAGFIEAFKWVTSFLREPDDYRLITRRLGEELIRQNVVYAEITVSVGVMLLRKQNVEANFRAICETAQSAPLRKLRTAWIFDAARQFGPSAAMEVARWAARLRQMGVVAFGMGGDELAVPTAEFHPAFGYARSEGLRIVCHAGETGGPRLVREAVELLGAERIGHGIAVMRDPALAESLAGRGIVLENCLASNLWTGALARQAGHSPVTAGEHPIRAFLERGLRVTLSTDDPAMFHTDLLSEYSLAASLGLADEQLLDLAEQGFRAAFLPTGEAESMINDFRTAAKRARTDIIRAQSSGER
jgi:adenosine deaminase/aminodeoxyfutalosine deaminase